MTYLYRHFKIIYYHLTVGRYSAVGTATRYRFDGPGIESRWGERDFPHTSRPALGPTYPASYAMGTGSFPDIKRPGRGVDHPPHLAPRLKKEYSYTSTPPNGPSWPVIGWTLPLPLPSSHRSTGYGLKQSSNKPQKICLFDPSPIQTLPQIWTVKH